MRGSLQELCAEGDKLLDAMFGTLAELAAGNPQTGSSLYVSVSRLWPRKVIEASALAQAPLRRKLRACRLRRTAAAARAEFLAYVGLSSTMCSPAVRSFLAEGVAVAFLNGAVGQTHTNRPPWLLDGGATVVKRGSCETPWMGSGMIPQPTFVLDPSLPSRVACGTLGYGLWHAPLHSEAIGPVPHAEPNLQVGHMLRATARSTSVSEMLTMSPQDGSSE